MVVWSQGRAVDRVFPPVFVPGLECVIECGNERSNDGYIFSGAVGSFVTVVIPIVLFAEAGSLATSLCFRLYL